MDVNSVGQTGVASSSTYPPKLPRPVFFTGWQRFCFAGKRLIDVLLSAVCLVVFLPLMIIIAAAVRLTSKGPAVFCQDRIGRYGRTIVVYKFRTMYVDAPNVATANLDNPDQYITPVGKILRKTSLDEFPQLFNILRGDMSFVGPRPLIPEEKTIHTRRLQEGVYYLRPGLTGLAQINGRDLVTPEQKVAYDAAYLRKFGVKLDFGIFFRTVFIVFTHVGIVDGNPEEETDRPAEEDKIEKAEMQPARTKCSQMTTR